MKESDSFSSAAIGCTECEFEVTDQIFAAKRWQPKLLGPSTPKILALHGWLDNCASFDFLAPQLNADIVCIDLAGHGRSSFRPGLGAYNVWLDLPELLEIADQLGWHQFSIIGHSRGAAVGFMLAGTFPKRIKQLICLDGIFPLVAGAQSAPEQLRHSIKGIKKHSARKPGVYSDFETAVAIREKSVFPVTRAAALALAHWGVAESEGGFSWRYDPKLNAPSEFKLTFEQVKAFAQNITAQVNLLLATRGVIIKNQDALDLLRQHGNWSVEYFTGGHHFHMDESVDLLADYINTVLGVGTVND